MAKPKDGTQEPEELHAARSCGDDAVDLLPPIIEDIGNGCFFVAHSKEMREIRVFAELVAPTSIPILVVGETGAGKEIVVRLIHYLSSRAKRQLLKVNCAALPAELLESELFGYEAGAFTGAYKSQVGKFEACRDGTILLDEIAEMPAGLQAKLLHVLQDGSFHRLGSPHPVHANARVLAATNVNIPRALRTGKFRADLYYRLNTLSIHVPPLRERKEDIPVLVEHFNRHLSRSMGCEPVAITSELSQACLRYSWPGNLRELENFVKRHLIVRHERRAIGQLEPNWIRNRKSEERIRASFSVHARDLKSLVRDLKRQAEEQAILASLHLAGGKRKEAARQLKISLRALLYKMREYGIDASKDTSDVSDDDIAHHRAKSATVGLDG